MKPDSNYVDTMVSMIVRFAKYYGGNEKDLENHIRSLVEIIIEDVEDAYKRV